MKHQLRDWIEARVAALNWNDPEGPPNLTVLQDQINGELKRADLFCPEDACEEGALGYLLGVEFEMQSGFLVIRTSIGLQICGTDDSAYLYEFTDRNWHRIWESEQSNYGDKTYSPQRLVEVRISPTDRLPGADRSEHLIVTTGVLPWCTSVWQPVYYRVWQTKSTYSKPLLLLDGSEQADISEPIHARANKTDVFIEYEIIADAAFRVHELRHYAVENQKLRRIEPVALTPQDFVSFWLRRSWAEVSEWTDQTARAALEAWRRGYKGTNSEFESPTRHCTGRADVWQVATDSLVDSRRYFLVRVRPPFRFSMVAASDRPWPNCTESDPAIDEAPDLFGN